jgi:hypothetical protein
MSMNIMDQLMEKHNLKLMKPKGIEPGCVKQGQEKVLFAFNPGVDSWCELLYEVVPGWQ